MVGLSGLRLRLFEAVEAVGEGEEEGFGRDFESEERFSDHITATSEARLGAGIEVALAGDEDDWG